MKAEMCELEVYVLVNEDGEAECGMSSGSAAERFTENVADTAEVGRRMVKLTVRVPMPKPIEFEVEVEEGEAAEATA